jgi:hypothetical protein
LSSLPAGDIFVTNSADTLFSVIASKGTVSSSTLSSSSSNAPKGCQIVEDKEQQGTCQQHKQQQVPEQQQQQLWKVFSKQTLSEDLLQQLFINSSVIISKPWKAYPK